MATKKPFQESEIIFYTTSKGDVRVEVFFQNETVWLTQKRMSELFDIKVNTINYHLKEIFKSKELSKNSVIRKIRITANDGKKYFANFYNLDVIIAVGYRVNSFRATQFRIWATRTLREYIVKGFVLDDKRLKQGASFGKDYFSELLEKIREIRSSERRFYQKITDIYALSTDYDKNSIITKKFFSTVQNKLHWAIIGKTAAEIIYSKVSSKKLSMGLKSWKNSPEGKILKSDTAIAKNYLGKKHIRELELIVSTYLDLAENRANRKIIMKMSDWIEFLNKFLELSNYPILTDKGKISKLRADIKASGEYDKFRIRQDKKYKSDFDIKINKYLKTKDK